MFRMILSKLFTNKVDSERLLMIVYANAHISICYAFSDKCHS